MPLPTWCDELKAQYESGAAAQFILSGAVADRHLLPLGVQARLGSFTDMLVQALMPRFDVVLAYDPGSGIRVEKGGDVFSSWPRMKSDPALPRAPRDACDLLTHYLRYCLNLQRLTGRSPQVGIIVRGAELIAPAQGGGEASAIACQWRDWADEALAGDHRLATVLVCDNLADLHPLVAGNPRACRISVPLPDADQVAETLRFLQPGAGKALAEIANAIPAAAGQLAGATLASVEALIRRREHEAKAITHADLGRLKKELVERDCGGLIEFLSSKRTLDDYQGSAGLKAWLRADLVLWRKDDRDALPKGYLLCGPVGTGKTFLVDCLAGEAGVPVVKLKNFRDKWVGSTEGNLEKIFRLIRALGRCYVFIDEADQALGKRDGGANDGGIGGRIYGMMAEEMSDPANRGRVIWILASSRPDLIEVDLKRPGRIDVKIPLFPTATAAESATLLAALCKRRKLALTDAELQQLLPAMPLLLTPGAAEAIAVKAYRAHAVQGLAPAAALASCLDGYQPPVPRRIIESQMRLALDESTDAAFVPDAVRGLLAS